MHQPLVILYPTCHFKASLKFRSKLIKSHTGIFLTSTNAAWKLRAAMERWQLPRHGLLQLSAAQCSVFFTAISKQSDQQSDSEATDFSTHGEFNIYGHQSIYKRFNYSTGLLQTLKLLRNSENTTVFHEICKLHMNLKLLIGILQKQKYIVSIKFSRKHLSKTSFTYSLYF